MFRFRKSSRRWWQKPLALMSGRCLPAELAVLHLELRLGETGAWLNSGSTTSGVVDLVQGPDGTFETERTELPGFVSELLGTIYEATGLSKGAPDLVLWDSGDASVRLVEAKCPHWDQLSDEQIRFLDAAEEYGASASVVEWEFLSDAE